MEEVKDLRVLVVEDDPIQRALACAALRKLGFGDVHEAADGVVALERLAGLGGPVDVALCDLQMDGMDGVELVRRLGEARLAKHVVLMSAVDRGLLQAVENMARRAGIDVLGLIEKPVTREKLAARLVGLGRRTRRTTDSATFTVDELREALAAGHIEPCFHPKMVLATGEIAGVEAVACWRRGPGDLVEAERWVAVAEAEGMIEPLTWTVLDASLAAHARWRNAGLTLPMSINLSHRFLEDLAAADHIFSRCNAALVDTRMITFEITETSARGDFVPVLSNLTRLRLRNFGLAIDDYGTGYASLDQLSQIPFTELKVDRRFVAGAASDPGARTILESSLDLGRRLGLVTVAQGVESEWELAALRKLPCDVVQGHYVSRALTEAELTEWMKGRTVAPLAVHASA